MELLTIQQVMEIFHLTNRKTIDNWLYSGTLPRNLTIKMGRNLFFVKAKLYEYLEETYSKQTK